jgi:hippurate hydrolase
MMFFRNFFSQRWLPWNGALAAGAIASSLLLFLAVSLLGLHPVQAQKTFEGTSVAKPAYFDRLMVAIDKDGDRLITIFKDIHQNPELSFWETRTAAIVAKELKALGYEVKTGIGKTGVVGILRNVDGPKVMYRADMDALPVEEATGLPG